LHRVISFYLFSIFVMNLYRTCVTCGSWFTLGQNSVLGKYLHVEKFRANVVMSLLMHVFDSYFGKTTN
jgi:hypothetical protein